jgi:acyl dehydratase
MEHKIIAICIDSTQEGVGSIPVYTDRYTDPTLPGSQVRMEVEVTHRTEEGDWAQLYGSFALLNGTIVRHKMGEELPLMTMIGVLVDITRKLVAKGCRPL